MNVLTVLHANSFVHGDLSPYNIMLSSGGRAVVIDFGFSKEFTNADAVRDLVVYCTVMMYWSIGTSSLFKGKRKVTEEEIEAEIPSQWQCAYKACFARSYEGVMEGVASAIASDKKERGAEEERKKESPHELERTEKKITFLSPPRMETLSENPEVGQSK